ncbi:glycine betaine/L-proline ABC transporter ATP-binding protein, partial [bacterium M00.F.Ca.ET.205.01.1.1]
AEITLARSTSRVNSARSLMRACGDAEHGGTVAPEAKIASFSADIVTAGKPFAVINGSGKPIGEVPKFQEPI